MFAGFALERVDVGGVELRVRHGGTGPPLVLLHGHPRTHTTWHRVAARLADAFNVVCPDLRGYGQSSKPPTTEDHAPYSKRALAADVVKLMHKLGHKRFGVAGHDRGSYVAYRLALDHPKAVTRLAVLDGVPIGEALARADAGFAEAWWHWFFFGVPEKPERAILADPDAWYPDHGPERMGRENWEDWKRAIRDPETVRAMLEDYRAGLGIDREADDADRAAGRTIGCPVLVAWSRHDDLEEHYGDPIEVARVGRERPRGGSRQRPPHGRGRPTELAQALRAFFA